MRRGPAWLPEALLAFSVVLGPLAFGAVEAWSKCLLEVSLYLLPVSCLWSRRFCSTDPIRTTLLPAAFAVVALGALQWLNPRPEALPVGLAPFTVSRELTGSAVILWGGYACLLAAAPSVLSERSVARRFAWILLGLGAFISVVGIVQRGLGNTAYYGLRPIRHGRPFGPYTNHDHAASMMGMCACVGLGIVSARFARLRGETRIGRLGDFAATQALLYAGVAAVVFGLIETRSRGALLALVATGIAAAMLFSTHVRGGPARWALRAVLAAGAAVIGDAVRSHPAWLGGFLTTPENSVLYRLSMYRDGWRLACDFPVFGTGLGAVVAAFAPYKANLIDGLVDHVHNDWLELLIQAGWVGAGACCAAAVALSVRIFRANPSRRPLDDLLVAGGAVAGVTFFLIHAVVEFSFQIPANAVLFLSLICLIGAESSARRLESADSRG